MKKWNRPQIGFFCTNIYHFINKNVISSVLANIRIAGVRSNGRCYHDIVSGKDLHIHQMTAFKKSYLIRNLRNIFFSRKCFCFFLLNVILVVLYFVNDYLMSRNFFFRNFDLKQRCKNELKDKNEKKIHTGSEIRFPKHPF